MNQAPGDRERLVTVESLLSHLQYDLEQLHQGLVSQGGEIDALRREMERLSGQIERLEAGPEEPGAPMARPPHY